MPESNDSTPEPRGDLVPPPHVPPTAVAAATPGPDPERTRVVTRAWRPPELRRRHGAFAAIEVALDALDTAGDAIAEAIGLR